MSITYVPVDFNASHVDSLVLKNYVNEFRDGFNLYGKTKCFLPNNHVKYIDMLENFNIRENDVFVQTFPKSGTTWMQELVWLVANDLDYEGAKVNKNLRFPCIETSTSHCAEKIAPLIPEIMHFPFFKNSYKDIAEWKDRRFIKTHLPLELMPKQFREKTVRPKVIYVARNPKDVCISFYYYSVNTLERFRGTLDDFCEMFLNDRIVYAPYWSHISEHWNMRDEPNFLYITFKEKKQDLESVIKKVAKLFDKELSTDQINKLNEHLSFESMKNNPATNFKPMDMISKEKLKEMLSNEKLKEMIPSSDWEFMREGKTDAFKSKMSPEYIKKFDDWIEKNMALYNLPPECFN